MKFLLDTQIVLWGLLDHPSLPPGARRILLDPDNLFVFSVSSIWEIAIKSGLKRPDFHHDPQVVRRRLLDNGCEELPVLGRHAVAVDSLPPIHKDPFDRILIAQAMVEGIKLLTADARIAQYPGPILKV
jgi:PIN domain nuclease of toxin-antitoxin system